MNLSKLTEDANRLGDQTCAVLTAKGLGIPEVQVHASEDVLSSFQRKTKGYKGETPLIKALYEARNHQYWLSLALDHKFSSWWLQLRPTTGSPTSQLTVPVSPRSALDLEAKIEGLLAVETISGLLDLPKLKTFRATLLSNEGEAIQVEVRAVDTTTAIQRAQAFVGAGLFVAHIDELEAPSALYRDEVVCAFR